ncbi:MAG TPA: hypothetical protein VHS28_00245 [Chloroflexota bacterium]|nr:hypothetical protein [Chloroflexota bacterium]
MTVRRTGVLVAKAVVSGIGVLVGATTGAALVGSTATVGMALGVGLDTKGRSKEPLLAVGTGVTAAATGTAVGSCVEVGLTDALRWFIEMSPTKPRQ